MKNFIVLLILLLNFFSSFKGNAHWEDQFDVSTGYIKKIVKIYPSKEVIPENQDMNDLEFRNRYRKKANIETDRLKFQTLMPSDVDLLHKELFDQENIMKYYYGSDGGLSLEYVQMQAFDWVNRWDTSPFSWWIIKEKKRDKLLSVFRGHLKEKKKDDFLGALGCHLDQETHSFYLTFLLRSEAQGKGYMTEALQKFIPYVLKAIQDYDLTFDTIVVPISPHNEKAIKLKERLHRYYNQSLYLFPQEKRLRLSTDICLQNPVNNNSDIIKNSSMYSNKSYTIDVFSFL